MLRAASFLAEARRSGVGLASGVPCSDLGALTAVLEAEPGVRWVSATNEGDAVAIASGAALAGVGGLVVMQNSGLGNAVNPLTSLNLVFRLPILLVIAWRGEPDGAPDEPQHAVMGRITPGLLDLLGIGWERLPREEAALPDAFARARAVLAGGVPYALVAGNGTLEPAPRGAMARPGATTSPASAEPFRESAPDARPTRRAAIAAVQGALRPSDVLLATTGYTGREMMAKDDRPNRLAMVGSMGCASSLGLGLASVRPERRVVVLDGDGAALMRLGALATIGAERPPNLLHVLLDNEAHDSTGGQATSAGSCDLGAVAAAAGYPRVVRPRSRAALADLVADASDVLTFAHVKIAAGTDPVPPRPTIEPAAAAARLRDWLAARAQR